MFSIPLKDLKADAGAPFPLYLFLRKNDKLIPIRLEGDALGKTKYNLFLDKDHTEVWVPNSFQQAYSAYISEEATIVHDVLVDKELTTEDKAQILSAVSQDVLRMLNQVSERGEDARKEGIKRCKHIADEILVVASQESNIYDEILALRNSQEEIEHSVIVGTIAVMFALSLGLNDEKILADLVMSAIFHDIGLVKIRGEVLQKSEASWTATERNEYEMHVQASLDILKESETEFHPRVLRMIKEHHENYDGSGFPEKLMGQQIDELSQILHLANLFDRLCTGKQTGSELSPKDSFDHIYEAAHNSDGVQEVQPELVERIFQFMLREKDSADRNKEAAAARMNEAARPFRVGGSAQEEE